MTEPTASSGRRRYEAEVYAEVASTNADKGLFDVRADPGAVAGRYSNKSGELYERRLAAEGGGYRTGLGPSTVDYRGVPHEQLISMVHDGVSPESVDEQGMIVNDLGNAFKEMSTALRQATAKEQAGWQGAGAQAAFTYLGGLAKWADLAGDSAFLAANRYSQTSAALANARNGMPEPAGRTVAQSVSLTREQLAAGDFEGALDTMNTMRSQASIAFQAQQQAAEVLAQRDRMLYSGGSTQPSYAAPPPLPVPSPAPARPAPGPDLDPAGTAAPAPGRVTPPQPASSAVAPSATHDGGSSREGDIAAPGSFPRGGATAPGDRAPGSGNVPAITATATAIATATAAASAEIAVSVAGNPGASSDGSRRGKESPARGADSSPDPGTGAPPPMGEPGAGRRTPARRKARAAAEPARPGLPRREPERPGAGPAMTAAGGKKADEDKEHKRAPYVVEADPHAVFGFQVDTDASGNKIAPPVIGE
ncbi:MAG TPA: hypothetical protein VFG87_22325 [Amycolatopsis sp.]|nr:hypothetical protein [Amycolatopsis sp.]